MSPRRKDSASTSGSSSSNSSSSSSSSGSSSSGSESSSSDSEASSSSANKSGHRTSDSEKKQSPKKKVQAGSSSSKNKESDASEKPKKFGRPPLKASTLFSSDSEDSHRKTSNKRKPGAKPKATATITPKVAKNIPKPVPKAKVVPKKPIQSVAKSTVKTADAPKLDSEEKKLKTKSIFSPDNSSDSDDAQTCTPPPPKLTAIKTSASKVKPKLPEKPSRASSVSSNSSNSSESSGSSSGSSSTDKAGTGGGGGGSGSGGNALPLTPRGRGRPPKRPPQLKQNSDEQQTTASRKQTRSTNVTRRSRLSSRLVTDSDSDTGSKTSASRSPSKKVNPKGGVGSGVAPVTARKQKGTEVNHVSHIPECEDKRCPLETCNSLGHLNGKLEKHFSLDACPVYHNLTAQQSKEMMLERRKKEEERSRAHANLKRTNASSPTPEQKTYRDKVKEMRMVSSERRQSRERPLTPRPDRLPDVSHYSNKYDFKLFQEAQALAAEIAEEEMKELAQYRATKYIEMGKHEMEVWYQSPYPEDFARSPKLYICEYCLRYMKSRNTLERHSIKCAWRHPPGEEVYRKDKISMWEVDGKRFKTYCQNLCLLAKFFLDHKTLYYDVEPFLFYVMTSGDSEGCHTVGYFSKEKNSQLNYNVSCILTLPPYQRQGYGRLLIDFSYLLTRVEGKVGSPEKPLSDLGLISYRSYWKDVLLSYLCNFGGKILSIKDISQEMAISTYDIVSTLQALGMIKYWKGKHIVLKKQDVIEEYLESSKKLGQAYREIDPKCLKWRPFVPASPHSS